jgi:hypothetical protein
MQCEKSLLEKQLNILKARVSGKAAGLAIKNPPKKTCPIKPKKNHVKKPKKNHLEVGFIGFF